MIYPPTRSSHTLLQGILIASLALLITACGGSSSKTPPDTTPEPFTFANVTEVEPGTWQTSASVTISDINVATPVSVSGGQYAIGNGSFTAAAGEITNGQELRVRIQAPAQTSTEAEMTVTVGTYSTTFGVTTFADTTPPTANIAFPPPFSATDRETLTIRGTAEDDYSDIAGVTVNVAHGESVTPFEAASDDGFATWTAEVTLAEGQVHTFTVEVSDAADNSNVDAAEAVVHQQAFGLAFPDDEVPISFARGLVYDETRNRVLITNVHGSSSQAPAMVISVDMETGQRNVFSSPTIPDEENVITGTMGIALDKERQRALVASYLDASIYTIDLNTGRREVLSSPTIPDSEQPEMPNPLAIAVDPQNPDVAYVVTAGSNNANKLVRINLDTGERALVTDNTMEDAGPHFGAPLSILIDPENNKAIVSSSYQGNVYSVDLDTGFRTIISGIDYPEGTTSACTLMSITAANPQDKIVGWCEFFSRWVELNPVTGERVSEHFSLTGGEHSAAYLYYVEEDGYVLRLDRPTQGLYAVDPATLQHVTISKSATE